LTTYQQDMSETETQQWSRKYEMLWYEMSLVK
jgi:hypothetical protein